MRRKKWILLLAALCVVYPAAAYVLLNSAPGLELLWEKEYGGASDTRHLAALGSDALIAYGPWQDVVVHGLDGQKRWDFTPSDPPGVVTGLAVDGDRVYVGSNSNLLYALNDKGQVEWKTRLETTEGWQICPVVDDEKLHAWVSGNSVYLIDRKGDVRWRKMLDAVEVSEPVRQRLAQADWQFQHGQVTPHQTFLASSGVLYNAGAGDDGLKVMLPDGTKEQYNGGSSVFHFVEDGAGRVWHLSHNATPRPPRKLSWLPSFLHGWFRRASAGHDTNLMVFDSEGQLLLSKSLQGGHYRAPTFLPDGSVILSAAGKLYCYRLKH